MKASGTCPKCACATIFVVPAAATASALTLATYDVFEIPFGKVEAEVSKQKVGGVEAWVCSQCGFTELFTTELAQLAALAGEGKLVRIARRDGAAGPYR